MQSSETGSDIVATLGTRGSPLALLQAQEVRHRLARAHGFAPERIAVQVVRTSGDAIQDRPLYDLGGKGLFTKEIEEALFTHRIDFAVHSAKDVPTFLPDEAWLAAWLPREDARDVFIGAHAKHLKDLPQGATVGTASLRRQAMVLRLRPDLKVIPFRGNVETRLRKLGEGEADATILALAGLKRLGMDNRAGSILSFDEMLPSAGQGAIAVEARRDDDRITALLAPINDPDTSVAITAERSFLALLDGTCRTPVGGHCDVKGERVFFRGIIISPDGKEFFETTREGARKDAAALGADAAQELRKRAGEKFFTLFAGA